MKQLLSLLVSVFLIAGITAGCSKKKIGNKATSELSGTIRIDGSSTVFPISEAIAEEFQKQYPNVRVAVGVAGTGGGFKKFALGEIDINNASRPIKLSETKAAQENKIGFIELPVAFDGLSVLVNPKNTWVDHLTVAELNQIWKPESPIKKWSDLRPAWPNQPISLYGPGTDSGTFDYFTETINGKAQSCRSDFMASEDDNVLVQGISGDINSLGFFGYAYYIENKEKLKVVPIDNGKGPVSPTVATINNGDYAPLSRPIFIYVSDKAITRPEVQKFIEFYLNEAPKLVGDVGYVSLPQKIYSLGLDRLTRKITGSVFAAPNMTGKSLDELMK